MVEQLEPSPEGQSGLVEKVAGQDVSFEMGIARLVSAQGNGRVSESLVYRIDSGGKMDVRNAAAAVLAASKDLTVKNVLGNVLVAGTDARVNRGSMRVAVAGRDFHASQSIVGLVIASKDISGDNNRILLDKQGAIFFGAAFGAALGLVSWLLWRKK
jgi:hypothetical protein